jgi:hypothetical protein
VSRISVSKLHFDLNKTKQKHKQTNKQTNKTTKKHGREFRRWVIGKKSYNL